ncbi:hypothetical protein BS50DRAFT_80244 [Corynespora cassiicola Philippines]|uniref:Uncharacterized protein n=1 Tax=Corynespora cassiicola Philippines TaxID=1448308 RepID=A0A2T2NI42_CORCC|nr:hypothetical protein BS50DRAFT_80244 [Corynespora cassiicola Philippines]
MSDLTTTSYNGSTTVSSSGSWSREASISLAGLFLMILVPLIINMFKKSEICRHRCWSCCVALRRQPSTDAEVDLERGYGSDFSNRRKIGYWANTDLQSVREHQQRSYLVSARTSNRKKQSIT